MCDSITFLEERINVTKTLIAAYEDAALAINNGVRSYTLDTGQTKEIVTKADEKRLNETLDGLYNRLATQCARLDGGDTLGVPVW